MPVDDCVYCTIFRLCSREDVEKLARLFDRLESEARRLSGADVVENVFGSELTKGMPGVGDIRPGIKGLFNIVIREIDYEVARVLRLEDLAEAVKGPEELLKLEKPEGLKGLLKGITIEEITEDFQSVYWIVYQKFSHKSTYLKSF